MATHESSREIPHFMCYPSSPPPPYTVVDTRLQTGALQLHKGRSPLDLKCDQARLRRAPAVKPSSKTGQRHDQIPRKLRDTHGHTTPRIPPVSNPLASRSQVCIRSTQISQAPPPLPERPATKSDPSPLSKDRDSKGTGCLKDICQEIDDAASELCVDISNRRPANSHTQHKKQIQLQHKNHTSLHLDEILPNAPKRENAASKVHQYANSRLPPDLPPLRASMDLYRLFSIAARYSLSAYSPPPQASTQESHIPASFLTGTKAMVLRSIPVDNQNTLVLSIRGSASFADWAVNFRPAPSRPVNFLDDVDNHCHSGFLSVARSMVRPIATRLKQLLEQDPSRYASTLLITGHSAGGAVAALLFAHMLSRSVESELTLLANFFSRVHCITFGAPPVSLLPLTKPDVPRFKKWCFFGVVNQGDPVVRAGKEYVASLAKLWLAPVPTTLPQQKRVEFQIPRKPVEKTGGNKCIKGIVKVMKSVAELRGAATQHAVPTRVKPSSAPVWKLPPAPLSCAGRLVVVREKNKSSGGSADGGSADGGVEACEVSDEMLRDVVFGDPAMHSMSLYARRVEMLAFRAVTGRES